MAVCCGKFLRAQRGRVAVTHRETLVRRDRVGALSPKDIKGRLTSSVLRTGVFPVAAPQGFEGGRRLG